MDLFNPATWIKVGADAAGLGIKQYGKLAGEIGGAIGGDVVRQQIINEYNKVGELIRNNPVIEAIDQTNEWLGLRGNKHPAAKELISYIDSGQDDVYPSITQEEFIEKSK